MYPRLYDALQLFSRSRVVYYTAAATRSDTAKTASNGAVCMDDVLSFLFFLSPAPPPRAKIRYANIIFELHLGYIMAGVFIIALCRRVTKAINSDPLPAVAIGSLGTLFCR